MKRYFLSVFLLITTFTSSGQNLIPNPDFEDTTGCPTNVSGQYGEEIYLLQHWFPALNSADYFNSCSSNMFGGCPLVSIPWNHFGYQGAYNGNGYIGMWLRTFGAEYREYVGVPLTQSLSAGTKYYFKAMVSSAFGQCQDVRTFANNFGIRVHHTQFNAQANPMPTPNYATAKFDSIIADTLNWVPVTLSFTATSSFEYLYLGNFFDDANTDTVQFSPQGGQGAYIYIDNVCLSTDSNFCATYTGVNDIRNQPDLISVIVANNIVIANAKMIGNYKLQIYDLSGRQIEQHSFTEQLEISTVDLPRGIYVYRILNGTAPLKTGKLVLD